MPKAKAVKPVRAWAVEADGEILPAWTNGVKKLLTDDFKQQREMLGNDVKIVRVELRKVKPKKRKCNAR